MSFQNSSSFIPPNITFAGKEPLFGGGGGNPTQWSLYPAISDVDMDNFDINNVSNIDNAVQISAGVIISPTITTETINIKNTNDNVTNILNATAGDLFFNGSIIKTGDNVTSLNALQNIVTISSTNNNLTVAEVGQDIQLTVLAGGIGVESLNSLVGNIGLTSTGGSVAITTVGNDINLELIPPPAGGVTSLNLNTGPVSIVGTGLPNDVLLTANNINPIIVSAPGIATAIADAAAAQATANTANATANTALADAAAAQATANTALANAAAASAAAAAASAAAAIADATALAASAAAATANGGVATILSSYVTQIVAGNNVTISPGGGTGAVTINVNNAIPYTLTGTTGGGVIVNRAIGSLNPFPLNTFTVATTITFNLPAILNATDSVYYDGWCLYDFFGNFSSFWGVSYFTNTFATETDILGSTTTSANALNFSNIQQIYLPLNLIIPPTNITAGGTVTFKIYCNPTSINHYITITPIINARIGVVKN